MPRPTNKTDPISAMQREYIALESLIAPLGAAEMEWRSGPDAWSIKDTLAHLHAWAQMYLGWYAAGRKGGSPHLRADGYIGDQQLQHKKTRGGAGGAVDWPKAAV